MTTENKLVVCHFYHPDFRRCTILNRHLEALAPQHFKTLFVKINAEICPFFVTKLKIRVLPTLLCFIDGKVVNRMIGFEELGNSDSFSTKMLQDFLVRSGIVSAVAREQRDKRVFGFARVDKSRRKADSVDSDSSEFDSDDE